MTVHAKPLLHIDFVSDVVCPWCAIGLSSLELALKEVQNDMDVDLRFQPFELNPGLTQGMEAAPYLQRKYGLTGEQLAANSARIAERGAEVGFHFGKRTHIWGTFDAHRLLMWAAQTQGAAAQHRLKRALLQAYHGEGRDPSDHAVLLDAVQGVGLDTASAGDILQDPQALAQEVRDAQAQWQARGITGVPAAVVNDQYVIAGGQPVEMYVRALRQIAAAQAWRDES